MKRVHAMTTASPTKTLLDGQDWQGKIFSSTWHAGGGGTQPVTNKSTGESMASLGIASAADAATAAKHAAAAQVAWGAQSREARAAILEKAKQLLAEHTDEFVWWIVRE